MKRSIGQGAFLIMMLLAVSLVAFASPALAQTTVSIDSVTVDVDGETTLPIVINNVADLDGVGTADIKLSFNSDIVHVTASTSGDFDSIVPNLEHNESGAASYVTFMAYQVASSGLTSGAIVTTVTLKAVGTAGQESPLDITITTLADNTPAGNDIPADDVDGTFKIPGVAGTTVSIDSVTVGVDGETTLPLVINNVADLDGVGTADIKLSFNSDVVHVTASTSGDFDSIVPNLEHNESGAASYVTFMAYQVASSGLTSDAIVTTVTLKAVGTVGQESPLDITITTLADNTPAGNDIPADDVDGAVTVVNNGYMGDGWQDGRNISALQCHEKGPINLTYSHGDSYYLSGYSSKWDTYTVNWTASDLNIPPTDTGIKKARLYAYYHGDKFGDKWANLSLSFNSVGMSEVVHYSDGKGFGGWDYSSDFGVLVYNVTDEFVIGNNIAVVTNSNPSEPKGITMEAMVLVVVYENPNEPDRIIWINEGCDLISSKHAKYGVSPEEATTYAAFAGCEPIPLDMVQKATLVSIAQVGNQGDDKNRLYFNDGVWDGLFPDGYVTGTNIGIHEANVFAYLKADDNVATYQDNGDMFAAANSFLIVEYSAVEPPLLTWQVEPPTPVTQGDGVTFDVSFSESANYYFRVEDSSNTEVWRYPTSGTNSAANPSEKTWTTTIDTSTGDYTIIINIDDVDNSNTRTVTVTGAGATVSIGSAEGSVGGTVDVSISIANASNIGAMDITVTYDASILTATNVANGTMVASLPDLYWESNIGSEGELNISLATHPGMINGDGELFVVTFDVVDGATGDSSPLVLNAEAWTGDVEPQPVTVAVVDGAVTVTDLYDSADTNYDCIVSMMELMTQIGKWKSGDVGMMELMTSIGRWKLGAGGYCEGA